MNKKNNDCPLTLPSLINETDPKKPQVLEMEVCHSRHLNMSSIHVYAQDASGRKLVSLAHTLDANTLPSPASLKCQNASVMVRWDMVFKEHAYVQYVLVVLLLLFVN